jgi:hypothetical protein
MRRAILVFAAMAAVAALSAGGALAAPPPSLKATVCANTATPQQLVVTQTWKNAGPADIAGPYTIVYDFQSGPTTFDTVDRQYIANPGDMVSGSQSDTFNPFVGPSGFVPWDSYFSVAVTWNVNQTTTVSTTVTEPKNGWRTCKN